MCECEVFISANKIHGYFISKTNKHLKLLDPNYSGHPRISSVDNFGTRYSQYRDEVTTNEKILNKKSRNYANATMCPFTIKYKDIPNWKCVIICCYNFTPFQDNI